jgi:hypothetical protein
MIEQQQIWDVLVEPITAVTPMVLVVWWLLPFSTVMAIGTIGRYVTGVEYDPDVFPEELSTGGKLLLAIVVVPVTEELLFRILPTLLGFTTVGMVLMTGVWVLTHGERAVFTALFAPVYLKMALGGLLLEVVLLHAVHNAIATTVHLYREKRIAQSENSEAERDTADDVDLTDPETWPDEWSE